MNEENVAIRLKGFIDSMGLTNSQFADTCGIPRPSLSQLLTGRNKKISDELIGKIHHAFPGLSVLWLLFGEGKMLEEDQSEPEPDSSLSGIFAMDNKIPDDGSGNEKYSTLDGLSGDKNHPSMRVNSGNVAEIKNLELMHEIENLRKNPRKVIQITLYYDDSTFETFFPNK